MDRRARSAVNAASILGVGAAAGAIAAWLADERRRIGLERQTRVWRLTARRGAHFAVVKVRGRAATDEARGRLEERFAIRTAEDVARELGQMKGAIMKAGQYFSFVLDGLPEEAQAALAQLQADVPPMAPSLAEQVVREDLGDPVERLFLGWEPTPVAAASIGQVHRAVLSDGRIVAVKVQYPGIDQAITGDLDNAEQLYGAFAGVAMRNLDVPALVGELRARMADELDYRLEATAQTEFADRFDGHPFIRVPAVVPGRSSRRVLTSDWVDGQRWDEFLASASPSRRQRTAEVLFRFALGSVYGAGVFNGDPHPGNYRFHEDGSVTFLDFGLVKRWTPGELEGLALVLDGIFASDPVAATDALVFAGFLSAEVSLDPQLVFDYVSLPYQAFMAEEHTYSRGEVTDTLATMVDLNGPYAPVIAALNLPPSFVILDRVLWGVSALLSRLEASNRWRAILAEYREGGPPATELGRAEAAWREASASSR